MNVTKRRKCAFTAFGKIGPRSSILDKTHVQNPLKNKLYRHWLEVGPQLQMLVCTWVHTSICSCTYTYIMGSWEDELLNDCMGKHFVYFRSVDIFGIRRGSRQGLEEFHKRAYSIHRDINQRLTGGGLIPHTFQTQEKSARGHSRSGHQLMNSCSETFKPASQLRYLKDRSETHSDWLVMIPTKLISRICNILDLRYISHWETS